MLETLQTFMTDYGWTILATVGFSLLLLVGLLVIIAFLLLMDRKVWAAVQMRRGPNVVGSEKKKTQKNTTKNITYKRQKRKQKPNK